MILALPWLKFFLNKCACRFCRLRNNLFVVCDKIWFFRNTPSLTYLLAHRWRKLGCNILSLFDCLVLRVRLSSLPGLGWSKITFEVFCINVFKSITLAVGFLAARGVVRFLAFFITLFFLSRDLEELSFLTLPVVDWFFHGIGWP